MKGRGMAADFASRESLRYDVRTFGPQEVDTELVMSVATAHDVGCELRLANWEAWVAELVQAKFPGLCSARGAQCGRGSHAVTDLRAF